MEKGEPILLICHGFPPVRGIGGRRWAKFAKELAGRGHPVHVIRNAGATGVLNSLWTADAHQPGIIHHPLPQRFPAVMTKRPLATLREKVAYRFWSMALPWFSKGNWRDATIFWRKQLLAETGRLIRQHCIRNVIVTGAPFRLLAHAAGLKESFPGIRLIGDLRDVWTWGPGYGIANLSPQSRQEEVGLEATAINHCDTVLSPHGTVIDHLQRTYGGPPPKFVHLPHAIDPDDFRDVQPRESDGVFRMIYAGSFYGAQEADLYFDAVLRSLGKLRADRPEIFANCRFDLYITGQGTDPLARQVRERGLGEQVLFHDPLPPNAMFKQMAGSDLVAIFIPRANKDIMGTKFNEVFYLGRPILHVGEPGLVGRTVLERRMGDSLRVDELERELPRIITGERQVVTDRNADHTAYLLPHLTDRLLNEVLA